MRIESGENGFGAVLHRGHPWPFDQRRVMRRAVTGDGDNPWAMAEAAAGTAPC